jgi:hypothetical protein
MYDEIDILQIDRTIQSGFTKTSSKPINMASMEPSATGNLAMSESLKKRLDEWYDKHKDDTSKNIQNFYLLDTVELVEDYKTTLQTPIKVSFLDSKPMEPMDTKDKVDIIHKYIDKVKEYNLIDYSQIRSEQPFSNNMNQSIQNQKCGGCKSNHLTESVEFTGVWICLDCGIQETTLNLANSIRLNHNDSKRVNICAKYSYDKKSHFLNCINQYQGKHKSGIEPQIITMIEAELEKYNLVDHTKKTKRSKYKNVTKEHIFLFVKELRLTKCYGDINLIHHLITGVPLNDINHLTEKLLQDFDQFVQMHHKLFPSENERKNFNYQHLLYQLLVRHKHPCNPNEFNFLKTVDRKYYHDEICRTIFENLGWNYCSLF